MSICWQGYATSPISLVFKFPHFSYFSRFWWEAWLPLMMIREEISSLIGHKIHLQTIIFSLLGIYEPCVWLEIKKIWFNFAKISNFVHRAKKKFNLKLLNFNPLYYHWCMPKYLLSKRHIFFEWLWIFISWGFK